MSDYARLNSDYMEVYGIQPNGILNFDNYLDYTSPESDLSVTEQLYTARGSQGAGMKYNRAYDVAADPSLYNSTY